MQYFVKTYNVSLIRVLLEFLFDLNQSMKINEFDFWGLVI